MLGWLLVGTGALSDTERLAIAERASWTVLAALVTSFVCLAHCWALGHNDLRSSTLLMAQSLIAHELAVLSETAGLRF